MASTLVPVERDDTFENVAGIIRRLAASGFSEHVVTDLGPNEWLCQKPHTGFYSFCVIVRTSMVLVYGDVGDVIFRGGEAGNTLGWLRSSVDSPSYLMSKIRPQQRTFYPGDALRYAQERANEGSGAWSRVHEEALELESHSGLHEHSWGELVMEHIGDCEAAGIGRNHTSDALWAVEALKWLVKHLPMEEAPHA